MSIYGKDLITGEKLTDLERGMQFVNAVVGAVTFGQGALALDFSKMTTKEIAVELVKIWGVDAIADASAFTAGYACDELGMPAGVSFLASMLTGCTVSVGVGGYVFTDSSGKIVKELDADEMQVFLKELDVDLDDMMWGGGKGTYKAGTEAYELLLGPMSDEDMKRYIKFLEDGSQAGLTPAEQFGLQKVDEQLLFNRIDYDEVLALRRGDEIEPVEVVAFGRGEFRYEIPIKGYSDLINGMSKADATRYITYNEAAFLGEFSERARAAGLNDTQIEEAFCSMRGGNYTKMASYFDTSSPVDGAVFWSGNKEAAAAYANSIGGTIMEQTPGGQVFDNWRELQYMYPEWDTSTNLARKPIWDALSSQYANGAEGIVTYAHPDGYEGKVWSIIEKPILEENNIIIQEVIIDAE